MRAGLKLITGPTIELVGTETVKKFLRVEVADDDQLIADMITAGREYIEEQTGFSYLPQTFDQTHDQFPYLNEAVELQRGPVISITSVKYTDSSGAQITWPSSNYLFNGTTRPPRIAPAYGQWWPLLPLQPLANVVIRFVAGNADMASVPKKYIQALYMLLGLWYESRSAVEIERGAVLVVPHGTDQIIAPLRPPLYA